MRGGGSDAAITVILKPFAYAWNPLVDRLPLLKIPINFFYGETDWMGRESADYLCE